jgi:hypothetical protein
MLSGTTFIFGRTTRDFAAFFAADFATTAVILLAITLWLLLRSFAVLSFRFFVLSFRSAAEESAFFPPVSTFAVAFFAALRTAFFVARAVFLVAIDHSSNKVKQPGPMVLTPALR